MTDPHDLSRFVAAQEGVYETALAELRAGRKRTHWIWFVFPQIAGLGSSPTSRRYAIGSLEEARAYAAHPVLGPRLLEATRSLTAWGARSARDVLGSPDDLKVRSSMTLFAQAVPDEPLFDAVLGQWYAGEPDPATLRRL